MCILTGEAFLTLLKSPEFIFVEKYLDLLKIETLKILSLWNFDLLEIWVEVYALVLAKLVKLDRGDLPSLQEECRKTLIGMAERNQAIKVRIKAA